ncbi:MAG: site-specific DNA-methyltransferase [Proteobacteria bacterium]|nr:site-specific DNA-methyltransferase [Pseudomonadota bacterium]
MVDSLSLNINCISKSHPRHYLIHKYWSRKPHNVVSNYIKKFTSKNEIVLDPFMGSGVTLIESLKLNRKARGFDINPISCFLVQTFVSKINIDQLTKTFNLIINDLKPYQSKYFFTKCPCGKKSKIINNLFTEKVGCDFCGEINYIKTAERKGNKYLCNKCNHPLRRINGNIKYQLKNIRGECNFCGIFTKEPDEIDTILLEKINKEFLLKKGKKGFWAPDKKIIDSVRRSGKERLYELFSERNLIGINLIIDIIKKRSSTKEIKNLLLLTLTSCLSSASRMIPADEENIRGKSGWQLPKFYIFPSHIEKNIFVAFEARFKRNLAGFEELVDFRLDKKNCDIYNKSSTKMPSLKSNSVDFIFTDPPYGGTIQYLALSELWNSVLNLDSNFKEEIVIDKKREKTAEEYKKDLTKVFKECYRVLKNNKYMALTFNARDMSILKSLTDSCKNAGFILMDVNHQDAAVTSATAGFNWKNTLKGDFIFIFKKSNKRF